MSASTSKQPAYNSIPFSRFVDLVHSLQSLKHKTKKNSNPNGNKTPLSIFTSWLKSLGPKSSLPPNTGSTLFKLLYPDQDITRRYGFSANTLARELSDEKVFGLDGSVKLWYRGQTTIRGKNLELAKKKDKKNRKRMENGESLSTESTVSGHRGMEGVERSECLGWDVVKDRMRSTFSSETSDNNSQPNSSHEPSIFDISSLLDELASLNKFSEVSIPRTKRNRKAILDSLLTSQVSPLGWGIIVQVILYDMRSLLQIHKDRDELEDALEEFTSRSKPYLSIDDAMDAWDLKMKEWRRVKGRLDLSADLSVGKNGGRIEGKDMIGGNVMIPKALKGRSCRDALQQLGPSSNVYAETKYDGERVQIHLDFSKSSIPTFKLISKSLRDSTMDRKEIHSIILAALGFRPSLSDYTTHALLEERTKYNSKEGRVKKNIILEAEMVAFDQERGVIAEFYKIKQIKPMFGGKAPDMIENCESYASDLSTGMADLNLSLVFFDLLLYEDESYLNKTYQVRRAKLEELITEIPGFTSLASRTVIKFAALDTMAVELIKLIAQASALRQEGLVLKSANGLYRGGNSNRGDSNNWVKVKLDYIDGLGDCLDMCIVGYGFDPKRAAELGGLPEHCFTTVYFGSIKWPKDPEDGSRPRIMVNAKCSYFPSRQELIKFNDYLFERHSKKKIIDTSGRGNPLGSFPFNIQDNHEHSKKGLRYLPDLKRQMEYTVAFLSSVEMFQNPQIVLLNTPLLAEFCGAGFDKDEKNPLYKLRWPRLIKFYEPHVRSWIEGVTDPDFQNTAIKVMRRPKDDNILNADFQSMLEKVSKAEGFGSIDLTEGSKLQIKPGHSDLYTGGNLLGGAPASDTIHPDREALRERRLANLNLQDKGKGKGKEKEVEKEQGVGKLGAEIDFSRNLKPVRGLMDLISPNVVSKPQGIGALLSKTFTSTNPFLPSASTSKTTLDPSPEIRSTNPTKNAGSEKEESQAPTTISSGLELTPPFLTSSRKKQKKVETEGQMKAPVVPVKSQIQTPKMMQSTSFSSNPFETPKAFQSHDLSTSSGQEIRSLPARARLSPLPTSSPDKSYLTSDQEEVQNAQNLVLPQDEEGKDKGSLVESWLAKGEECSLVSPSKPSSPPPKPQAPMRSCFKGTRDKEMELGNLSSIQTIGAQIFGRPSPSITSKVDETRPLNMSRITSKSETTDSVTQTSDSLSTQKRIEGLNKGSSRMDQTSGKGQSRENSPMESINSSSLKDAEPKSSPPTSPITLSNLKRKSPELDIDEQEAEEDDSPAPAAFKKSKLAADSTKSLSTKASTGTNPSGQTEMVPRKQMNRSRTLSSLEKPNPRSERSISRSATVPNLGSTSSRPQPYSTSKSSSEKLTSIRTSRGSLRLMDAMFYVPEESSLSNPNTAPFIQKHFGKDFISSMVGASIAPFQDQIETSAPTSMTGIQRMRPVFVLVSREKANEKGEEYLELKKEVIRIKGRQESSYGPLKSVDGTSWRKVKPCVCSISQNWRRRPVKLIDEEVLKVLRNCRMACDLECGNEIHRYRDEDEKGVSCTCCSHLEELQEYIIMS